MLRIGSEANLRYVKPEWVGGDAIGNLPNPEGLPPLTKKMGLRDLCGQGNSMIRRSSGRSKYTSIDSVLELTREHVRLNHAEDCFWKTAAFSIWTVR